MLLSKVIERLVCKELVAYLKANNLLPRYQSAYRRHHSTETAVLKIISDANYAAEQDEVTLFGMLDMSAAFDTVDHDILLGRLQTSLRHMWSSTVVVFILLLRLDANGRYQQSEV